MSNINNNDVLAQIRSELLRTNHSLSSDFVRAVDAAHKVVVDGDCCLVIEGRGAHFYFRAPLVGGPRWGYRHSYRAPRRPCDAARYLRHAREAMREDGWEV